MAAASPTHTFGQNESSIPSSVTNDKKNSVSEHEQDKPMNLGTNILVEEYMTVDKSSHAPEQLQNEMGLAMVEMLGTEQRNGSTCVENELMQENCTMEEISSLNLISLNKRQEIVSDQVQKEVMVENEVLEDGMSELVVQHCRTEGMSNPDPIASGERQELAFEEVQNKPMKISTIEFASSTADIVENPSKDESTNKKQAQEEKIDFLKSLKRKHLPKSSERTSRVLRSRSRETETFPDPNVSSISVIVERKKKRKKTKTVDTTRYDEFSKARKRIRYLLTRMGYEQSLIDAYSGEGWKGQSAEKVKPEKELARAASEILQCKQKIRDLFQHLDALCSEGKHQESLFDSDGEISSEDIFCAKCGSAELFADNDIILCDGNCDRGFHQMCLDPPLLKEEIPLGDEGWLCPGCDCKVDCLDLLNDLQETDLSVEDSWEMVFPEAVAPKMGNELDNFSSDDSDDNDYDPDCPQVDKMVQKEDSSSDESDFTSASDGEVSLLPKDEQFLGLPSDDSEDDNYDPSGLDVDQKVNSDSSSSDFTSDSDDFGFLDDPIMSLGTDEKPSTNSKNKQPIDSEMLSLLELNRNIEPVSERRQIERLDYKKLHDEAYGNVPDSSDDEDWDDIVAPRKRSKNTTDSGHSHTSNQEQFLGLPSDDSEDDYDPSALDLDEKTKTESSSSDFTSDSEDFEFLDNPNMSAGTNEKPSTDRKKKQSINSETLSLLESDQEPLSSKRQIERLDYKKLHDEEYGNVSDSSNDEDWTDVIAPRKRITNVQKNTIGSSTGELQFRKKRTQAKIVYTNPGYDTGVPEGTSQKLKIDSTPCRTSGAIKNVQETDCTRKSDSPLSLFLGNAISQRLMEYLKEDPYPGKERKEQIANELGIPYNKVKNWYDSTRKKLRKSFPAEKGSKKETILTITSEMLGKANPEVPSENDIDNEMDGQKQISKSVVGECSSSAMKKKVRKGDQQQLSIPKDNAVEKASKKADSKLTLKKRKQNSPRAQTTREKSGNTSQRVTRSQSNF